MIVVVGHPAVVGSAAPWRATGAAAVVAIAAARRGAAVQLIGKVGDDDAGDALLVELTRAGVGHAALLRDPARQTPRASDDSFDAEPDSAAPASAPWSSDRPTLEPADVDLGLRYFTDFRVVLAAEPLLDEIRRVVVDAARYAGAALILVTEPGNDPGPLPDGAMVLEQPAGEAGDGFAVLLGEVAAAIDAGRTPAEALDEAAAAVGAVRPAPG
jgi:hypothetical protein